MHRVTTGRSVVFVALVALVVGLLAPEVGAQSKSDVSRAKDEREAAYRELVEANEELGAAVARLEAIEEQLWDLHRRIERIESRIDQYEGEARRLEEQVRELVVEAYVTGGSTQILTSMFAAASFQDVLTSQVLIDRAAVHDLVALDRLGAVSREMDRLTVELGERTEEVRRLEAEQQALVEELGELQRRAQAAFDKANRKYKEVYARYVAAQRRAAAAAAARRTGAAKGLPASATKGVICPVKGSTWFRDSWGDPRSGGRTHKGVDMAAAAGTPLVAMYSGTVRVNTHYLGGKQVYVYGDNGIFYYYAHLSRWAKGLSSGDRVKKGQVIGYVGNTGNATGYVLHLGMGPIGGGFVNPYPTVRQVC
ncbi:MAG TPA: hypothetical protein ENK55_11715 [Actinobacteria bacterium]|nr:hypothetical protein [Actinomycetota bacterium]